MILEHGAMFISVLSILMKRVNFCRPLAELGASFRVYTVADRYYRIEIIIIYYIGFAIRNSCCIFATTESLFNSPLVKNFLNVWKSQIYPFRVSWKLGLGLTQKFLLQNELQSEYCHR